ncbi:MAG: nucleotidyl transferase AbiEii/AbiGii toxin family protein [Bacteroidota bacterium]
MFHLSTVEQETYNALKELFKIPAIKENFALAGGTSLALQLGHRQSIDLDIFTPQSFSPREIELLITADSSLRFDFVNSNKSMLFCYVNKIKCDFIYEPSKLIKSFAEYDSVNYFSIEDIAAMKMHTICGRGKRKDFFDIYVLIENYGWKTLLEWFTKKYDSNQLYFLWRSIFYFKDADEDAPIRGLAPYSKSWEEIKEFVVLNCV